ncbi:nucleotidyltransferase domain-containing protein [Candidatus Woesearchaeota archaeon]|nr:nucleotidyltransferase domain-containing protein [Candidatus Woesearchaeota archaeon]
MIEKYALFRVFAALRNSGGRESVHSAAKKAKVSVSAAKHCLDYLFKKNMLTKEVFGRMYQYGLNLENPALRHIKVAFSLQELQDSGIVEETKAHAPDILSITLFGSTATGRDTLQSDIDIVIVSREKHRNSGFHAEKKIGREMSWHWYSLNEWKKIAAEDKPFYESVVIDGIPLFGEKPVVK